MWLRIVRQKFAGFNVPNKCGRGERIPDQLTFETRTTYVSPFLDQGKQERLRFCAL